MSRKSYLHRMGWSWGASQYGDVEQVTLPSCRELVTEANNILPLDTPNLQVLDLGCGHGALTMTLRDQYPNVPVIATDISNEMINLYRQRARQLLWRNTFAYVADGRNLKHTPSNSTSHVFSTFMINFTTKPDEVASEMLRILRPGGLLCLATWADPSFRFYTEPWETACREQDRTFCVPPLLDEKWCDSRNVEASLSEAGFVDIDLRIRTQQWPSVSMALRYFFEGDNPVLETIKETWGRNGESRRRVDQVFTGIAGHMWETEALKITLAFARKPYAAESPGSEDDAIDLPSQLIPSIWWDASR